VPRRTPIDEALGPVGNKETDVLKKTNAYSGLVIATAAGALLTGSPAYAQVDLASGSSSHHRHRSHNRNWNGNHNRPKIYIRIYIYNKNNNKAIAVVHPERDRATRVVRMPSRAARFRHTTSANRGPVVTGQTTVPAGQVPATAGQRPTRDDQGGADQSAGGTNDGANDATPAS
jgi:hypothetical protein